MKRRGFLSFVGLSPAVALIDRKSVWEKLKEFFSPRPTTITLDQWMSVSFEWDAIEQCLQLERGPMSYPRFRKYDPARLPA